MEGIELLELNYKKPSRIPASWLIEAGWVELMIETSGKLKSVWTIKPTEDIAFPVVPNWEK